MYNTLLPETAQTIDFLVSSSIVVLFTVVVVVVLVVLILLLDKIEFFPIAVLGLVPAAGSSSSIAGAAFVATASAATIGNSIPHPSQNLFSPGTKLVPHILHFILAKFILLHF
jgi:hypothetical protein